MVEVVASWDANACGADALDDAADHCAASPRAGDGSASALAFSRVPFPTAPARSQPTACRHARPLTWSRLLALLLVLMMPGLITLLPSSSSGGRSSSARRSVTPSNARAFPDYRATLAAAGSPYLSLEPQLARASRTDWPAARVDACRSTSQSMPRAHARVVRDRESACVAGQSSRGRHPRFTDEGQAVLRRERRVARQCAPVRATDERS